MNIGLFSLCFSIGYRVLSSLAVLLLLPLLPWILVRAKYRDRLWRRLGWGLAAQLRALPPFTGPCLWLHALSVGELTSALPLIRGLRQHLPEARILVSATTRSGEALAQDRLVPHCDALIAAPLDLGPVVPYFLRLLRPDLFLLVETDFWPHWLHCLAGASVPAMLVNGRISAASLARYWSWRCLIRPMFGTFSLLSMQTAQDAARVIRLGAEAQQVRTLGNLKFDSSALAKPVGKQERSGDAMPTLCAQRQAYGFSAGGLLWICGSTHRGEEAVLFKVYQRLVAEFPDLQLLIAPRNIERAAEIAQLAPSTCACRRQTIEAEQPGPVLILDTIGELAACYAMADLVFVGGSLVAKGGHNPIESAAVEVPVLFGPHMEDFSEIAGALVANGGALQVAGAEDLEQDLRRLFADPGQRRRMAAAAGAWVQANQGVVAQHLLAIKTLLKAGRPSPVKATAADGIDEVAAEEEAGTSKPSDKPPGAPAAPPGK